MKKNKLSQKSKAISSTPMQTDGLVKQRCYIGSFEAKTFLSAILSDVKNNNMEYVITVRGTPIAIVSSFKGSPNTSARKTIESFVKNKISKTSANDNNMEGD